MNVIEAERTKQRIFLTNHYISKNFFLSAQPVHFSYFNLEATIKQLTCKPDSLHPNLRSLGL